MWKLDCIYISGFLSEKFRLTDDVQESYGQLADLKFRNHIMGPFYFICLINIRFSCLSREYKYFFWKDKLNIEVIPLILVFTISILQWFAISRLQYVALFQAMELAGKRFIGEHDFRNFCKMDALNIHNYSRRINHFDISCCDER